MLFSGCWRAITLRQIENGGPSRQPARGNRLKLGKSIGVVQAVAARECFCRSALVVHWAASLPSCRFPRRIQPYTRCGAASAGRPSAAARPRRGSRATFPPGGNVSSNPLGGCSLTTRFQSVPRRAAAASFVCSISIIACLTGCSPERRAAGSAHGSRAGKSCSPPPGSSGSCGLRAFDVQKHPTPTAVPSTGAVS